MKGSIFHYEKTKIEVSYSGLSRRRKPWSGLGRLLAVAKQWNYELLDLYIYRLPKSETGEVTECKDLIELLNQLVKR